MLVRLFALVLFTLSLAACGGDDDPTGQTPDASGSGTDALPPDPTPTTTCRETREADSCVVTGEGDEVLVQGTVLAPGEILVGGQVLVDDAGRILCVSCDCEASATSARLVDCGSAVVSPGLVNPHDHLTFTEGAPIDHGAERYEHRHDWRAKLSTPANPHGTGPSSQGMQWGELRHLMGGTTSLAGSGHASGLVRNLDRGGAAQEGLDQKSAKLSTFPLGDSNREHKQDCRWRYAIDEFEVADEDAFVPHVAEGIDAYAADEVDCQLTREHGGMDFAESNVAMVHAIGIRAEDALRLASERTQIIWSPRSNIDLYGMTAPVTLFHRLGGVIALGTDWTYSGSIHMGRELACADSYNRDYLGGTFTDSDLWRMATAHGARALGMQDQVGALEVGLAGDIAVFASGDHAPHRAVIEAGTTDVLLVLRGGDALFGEDEAVEALRTGCDAFDMCGAGRRVCADPELGTSLAALESELSGAYPLWFCGEAPDDEPTCVPSRPGAFTGMSSATDADGDGIEDADDLCPRVFSPVRPLDEGKQPDADGDGQGDVCDEAPLSPDVDGDGVANEGDLCPLSSDPDQTDTDDDGRGDVCDACPEAANPDRGCPRPAPAVASIVDIQMDKVAPNTRVAIEGVVTAVSWDAIVVQDPTVTGGQYAGIYVYTASMPTVARDERVMVTGTYSERFDNSQIAAESVQTLGAATPVAPVSLTVAEAATEPYEGVLVTVTDAVVTSAAYDCGMDPPMGVCTDDNLWEVGGATGLVMYDKFYEAMDWVMHIGEVPVTGVTMYRFDRYRLMPRTANDLG